MSRKSHWLSWIIVFSFLSSFAFAEDDGGLFQEFEIRVIRPRYFVKRQRLELGIQFVAITNQTFVYTYLASAKAAYHLFEQLAVELSGAYGLSMDREDKGLLDKDFGLRTQISTTEYYYGADLLWTPIYGKYQLRNGSLIYFDTFISGGGGLIGISHRYDHCSSPDRETVIEGQRTGSSVFAYPFFEFGIGQRFFLNTNDSLRWDIKSQSYPIDTADTACFAGNTSSSVFLQNVTLQFGYSHFF